MIRDVCTSGDVDFQMLAQQAKALGWIVMGRSEAPDAGNPNICVADPLTLVAILSHNPPVDARALNPRQKAQALRDLRETPPTQADMLARLAATRRDNASALVALLPNDRRGAFQQRIASAANLPAKDQPHDYALALGSIAGAVRVYQRQTLERLQQSFVIPPNDGELLWIDTGWTANDLVDADAHLRTIVQRCNTGYYQTV